MVWRRRHLLIARRKKAEGYASPPYFWGKGVRNLLLHRSGSGLINDVSSFSLCCRDLVLSGRNGLADAFLVRRLSIHFLHQNLRAKSRRIDLHYGAGYFPKLAGYFLYGLFL